MTAVCLHFNDEFQLIVNISMLNSSCLFTFHWWWLTNSKLYIEFCHKSTYENWARGNRKTLKWLKMITNSNFRNLKLKIHEEYIWSIVHDTFCLVKDLIFKLNRKVGKGKLNEKMTRSSKSKAYLQIAVSLHFIVAFQPIVYIAKPKSSCRPLKSFSRKRRPMPSSSWLVPDKNSAIMHLPPDPVLQVLLHLQVHLHQTKEQRVIGVLWAMNSD